MALIVHETTFIFWANTIPRHIDPRLLLCIRNGDEDDLLAVAKVLYAMREPNTLSFYLVVVSPISI